MTYNVAMHAESASARLCLVVPCYNEAQRLRPEAFLEFVRSSPATTVLCVDDGSTDATPRVLAGMAAASAGRVDVLTLSPNGGKARAVQRGIVAALSRHPEFVGYWDSDLSTPLDAVAALLHAFDVDPGLDIAVGSRVKLLGRDIRRSASRHYVGRVFATLASLVLRLEVYDTQCGAKIFRANDRIARVFSTPFRSAWIFDVEMLARYVSCVGPGEAESRICEVPLQAWRDVPGSKVKVRHGLRAAWDLARIRGFVRQWQAGAR